MTEAVATWQSQSNSRIWLATWGTHKRIQCAHPDVHPPSGTTSATRHLRRFLLRINDLFTRRIHDTYLYLFFSAMTTMKLSDILASQASLLQEASEALPHEFSQCTYGLPSTREMSSARDWCKGYCAHCFRNGGSGVRKSGISRRMQGS